MRSKQPLALFASFCCSVRSGADDRVGKPIKFFLVRDEHLVRIGFVQEVLSELDRERCDLGVNLRDLLFVFFRQQRASAFELLEGFFE